MDEPGRRVSSVSVQIVGSVLITGGLLLLAYSGYVIWQVVPGLNVSASWAVQGRMSALLWALRVWPCSHSDCCWPCVRHAAPLKPAGSDRRSAGTAQTVKHGVRTAEFARHNGGIWQLDMIHEYYDARNVVCFAQYIRSGYGYQTGDCGVSDQGPQDR